jgi:hypothetical protein
MSIIKGSFLLIAASFSIIACASSPESSDPTGQTSESALTGKGGSCNADSSCKSSLVCNPHCPSIPGRAHCEIAGGTCGDRCELTSHDLAGTSFASTDGAHSLSFETDGTFVKLDGCANTGIHCNHIQRTTGTFSSTGTTIHLKLDLGGSDTVSVEKHCYQGLLDNSTGVELYPSN